MAHRFGLHLWTVCAATLLALFGRCTRDLLDPQQLTLARGYAFLSSVPITTAQDTVGLAVVDTVKPGDTVHLAALVTAHAEQLDTRWDFGDGRAADGTTATTVYTRAGTYGIRFVVADTLGNEYADTVFVHVNTPPSIRGGANGLLDPANSSRGLLPSVPLVLRWRSADPDSGDTILASVFLGTSPGTMELIASDIDTSSLTIDQGLTGPATYSWFVVVVDRVGQTDTSVIYTFSVSAHDTVGSVLRIADLRPDGTIADRTPTISASFSGATADPTSGRLWLDGAEITSEALFTTAGVTWHATARLADGAHTVRVAIGDSLGNNAQPREWSFAVDAMILEAGGDTTVAPGDTVLLLAVVRNVFSAVSTYRWDFDGDGRWDLSRPVADTVVSQRHAYPTAGRYTAIVEVTDDRGTVKTDSINVFVETTRPVIQSIGPDTTISIHDSVTFTAVARDLDGRLTEYAWDFDGNGTDDAVHSDSPNAGHRYDSVGTFIARLRVTDDQGLTATDSVTIRVVRDVPRITYLSPDTVVDFGGTVTCTLAVEQVYGTLTVYIDTTGSGPFVAVPDHETYAVHRFTTNSASSWDSVRVRVVDDDGNEVEQSFNVDIRPRAITIHGVDGTDSTVSVRYSKTREQDFAEYRIYWDSIPNVDAGDNLLTRVQESSVVQYTDGPSFSPRPRYYRIYQVDTEGVWSRGSNVVFGNILVTPPSTPTLVHPAVDRDTIWSNTTVRWHAAVSPLGAVRYRLLLNPNKQGYVTLADGLRDTFFVLKGYESATLSADLKVVAYDGRASSASERTDILFRSPISGRMRAIPAGSFVNGAGESVAIDYSYWMDTTEVTQKQYLALINGQNPSFFKGAERPVEQVTWYEALIYCNARSRSERLDTVYTFTSISSSGATNLSVHPDRNGYRLPTENEWEMAARGGQGLLYPTDDGTIGDTKANYANLTTENVAGYPPNPYTLYNMAGNVSEWCWDSIFADRVARGGNWSSRTTIHLRVTRRLPAEPSSRNSTIGFRCVRPAH